MWAIRARMSFQNVDAIAVVAAMPKVDVAKTKDNRISEEGKNYYN
jgi:hypothetical protein